MGRDETYKHSLEKKKKKLMHKQIALENFQTRLIQYIAAASLQQLGRKKGNVKWYKLFFLN